MAAWASGLMCCAVMLSGCGSPAQVLGLEANTSVPQSEPALTADQAVQIAQRALSQVQRADVARTEQAAAAAFTGVARQLAPPAYIVQRALSTAADRGQVLGAVARPSRVVVTAGRAYPRLLLAVWTPTASSTPELAVLSTTSATRPYQVSARITLVPGTTLPATATNSRGAPVLSANERGLSVTPQQAVVDLARLLQNGKSGRTAFASSKLVADVRALTKTQARDVRKVSSFRQRHTPAPTAPQAVRTADGGALVLAVVNRFDAFRVRPGAGSLVPSSRSGTTVVRALNPKAKSIKKSLDITTVQLVALAVPPAGGGRVRVVGFSATPTRVQAS
ncbi:MAG: hypothetical protein ACRC35_07785 [Angustibacter sp.]